MISLQLPDEHRLSTAKRQAMTATLVSTVEIDLQIAGRAVVALTPIDLFMPLVDTRIRLLPNEAYLVDVLVLGVDLRPGAYRALARLPCNTPGGALLSNRCEFTVT